MSQQFHVAGPVSIYYGGEETADLLGQGDGLIGVTIRELQAVEELPTDNAGGIAEDFVQKLKRALVLIRLVKWDHDLVNEIRGWLYDNAGTPALAAAGHGGTVGLLRRTHSPLVVADGDRSLVLIGTGITANHGMKKYTFHDAITDPDTPIEVENISSKYASLSAAFLCYPNASGQIWTEADITAG